LKGTGSFTFEAASHLHDPLSLFQSWKYHLDSDGHKFMGDVLYAYLEKELVVREKK
jgi:hypothetical protein